MADGKNTVSRVSVPASPVVEELELARRERKLYGRKLSAGERRLQAAMRARQDLEAERDARAKADAARYVLSDIRSPRAEAAMLSSMNPLVVAAGATSPVAMAATAAPAVLQARKDLSELGVVGAASDPEAVFNLAMLPGLMTYGASAARLGRYPVFERLSGRNASPRTVLRRTGYQRGPFGYGVETRGDAYFRPSVLFREGGARGTLGELADVHPDVTRAYPGFDGDVRVNVVPDAEWAPRVKEAEGRASAWSRGDTSKGFFDRVAMEANVRGRMQGESLPMYFDRVDKTLAHELQHAAHEMDGIPPPKRRGDFASYRMDAREVDARNSANRNLLTPEERVEMLRSNTQDVRPSEVHLADRGGGSPHKNFHNFLATDDVPETLFGFPVVQREGDYTEADLRFFKENPKAAGFYDMGDEETEE